MFYFFWESALKNITKISKKQRTQQPVINSVEKKVFRAPQTPVVCGVKHSNYLWKLVHTTNKKKKKKINKLT